MQLAGLRAQREAGREDVRDLITHFHASVARLASWRRFRDPRIALSAPYNAMNLCRRDWCNWRRKDRSMVIAELCVAASLGGNTVNHKWLFRICRAAGLSVKRKRRKRLVRLPGAEGASSSQAKAVAELCNDWLSNCRAVRGVGWWTRLRGRALTLELDTSCEWTMAANLGIC